jgi:hypothetical protein
MNSASAPSVEKYWDGVHIDKAGQTDALIGTLEETF